MRHQHGPHCGCGCQQGPKKVVYPVKEEVVHCCTEETIEHVHPSHTTVVNHHLTKNKHVFPHSTSVKNTSDSVDEYGGPYNNPGNQVGGAMSPGSGNCHHKQGGHMQGHPGYGHHMPPHMKPCKKPRRWW